MITKLAKDLQPGDRCGTRTVTAVCPGAQMTTVEYDYRSREVLDSDARLLIVPAAAQAMRSALGTVGEDKKVGER